MAFPFERIEKSQTPNNGFGLELLHQKKESNPTDKNVAEIRKVSQDFEALFIQQVLKEMRNSSNENWDILGGGFGSKMVRDMLDGEWANHMAQREGLGVAKMMLQQLTPTLPIQSQKSE